MYVYYIQYLIQFWQSTQITSQKWIVKICRWSFVTGNRRSMANFML